MACFILPQLSILGRNHIPVIQPCVWLCICVLNFWMEIRGGGEIILWPGTGDFQVDSNKSSSHSLEPIIGRVLQSHTFTAAPLEWFCFLHFVFTFGDLKHRQSHQMHWHPLCLLEHSSTPQICPLFLGSCGRDFHSEYSRYGHTCQRIHWPNTFRQGWTLHYRQAPDAWSVCGCKRLAPHPTVEP